VFIADYPGQLPCGTLLLPELDKFISAAEMFSLPGVLVVKAMNANLQSVIGAYFIDFQGPFQKLSPDMRISRTHFPHRLHFLVQVMQSAQIMVEFKIIA
jgi:hypothetical protein